MKKMSNKNVFTWSIIVALGGFLFGFDTAVISGVEKQIQDLFRLSAFQQRTVAGEFHPLVFCSFNNFIIPGF